MPDWNGHDRLLAVPLFPLPNVVLFPRAVLPLHIFEERYKTMTADALGDRRLVAMALLKPGWERDYYSRPTIEPVVCIGKILTHEQLPDGKFNFLLQGVMRAKIVHETEAFDLPYRTADLDPLPEAKVMEIDLTDQRHKLIAMFDGRFRGEWAGESVSADALQPAADRRHRGSDCVQPAGRCAAETKPAG